MKGCSYVGCNYPANSHGFCWGHQRYRTDDDYLKAKQKKNTSQYPQNLTQEPRSTSGRYKIPKESKKRSKDKKHYAVLCKELEQQIRKQNNGKIFDFFTGLEIKGFVTWHHLLGRTGDFYLDKDLLVPAENNEDDGHLFWHRATLEQLKEKNWYGEFLTRLKNKSHAAYNKEMRKHDKKLNPTLFDEED